MKRLVENISIQADEEAFTSTEDQERVGDEQFETEEKGLDLTRKSDLQELKMWCRIHWHKTVKKGLESCNKVTYHDCCFTFCRRGFLKKAGHPELESASVLRIPSLKYITTADQFYQWIVQKARERFQQGQRMLFPSINRLHVEEDSDLEVDEHGMLAKRCEELSMDYQRSLTSISRLTEDNSRLLLACKNWCQKYHELLAEHEDAIEQRTEWEEPKNKLLSCESGSELMN